MMRWLTQTGITLDTLTIAVCSQPGLKLAYHVIAIGLDLVIYPFDLLQPKLEHPHVQSCQLSPQPTS